MTERELNKIFFLKKEAEAIQNAITKLDIEIGLGSPSLSGMPKTSTISSSVERIALERTQQYERLFLIQVMIEQETNRILDYIYHCPESEIRLIMRYRFIECYDWGKIGDILYMDRRTARRKLDKYLREN